MLAYQYQIADIMARNPETEKLRTHSRMFENVMFVCAMTAALLARGTDIAPEKLFADFPLLSESG